MEEKQNGKNRPLRQAIDYGKEIAKAYKNLDKRGKRQNKDIEESEDILDQNIEEQVSEQEENLSDSSRAEEDDNTIEIHMPESFKKEIKEKEILEARLEELEKEKSEIKERLILKAAELENFRKRTMKEKQDMLEYANQNLLYKMLPLLDDLSNALQSAEYKSDYESLLQGVEMINQKAKKLFEEAGVTEMENPEGKEFDVDYHEAMMTAPSELPEGYVVQQVQKGFMIGDKVLRHAKVITSSGEKP